MIACGENNDVHVVKYLTGVMKKAVQLDTDIKDENGFTALHHAAVQWNVYICGLLLKAGANFGARCKFGNTPLMYAIITGRSRRFAIGIRHG